MELFIWKSGKHNLVSVFSFQLCINPIGKTLCFMSSKKEMNVQLLSHVMGFVHMLLLHTVINETKSGEKGSKPKQKIDNAV